jgi:hypothetical protein
MSTAPGAGISRTTLLTVLLVAAAAACTRTAEAPPPDTTRGAAASPAAATPASLGAGALARLRWIEGSWRGVGDEQPPFFERYRFLDDSTLLVDAFADSALGRVTETSRFELRAGTLANTGDGARWAAIALDDGSVTFAPVARARNSFTWRRESSDAWTAILTWPASSPGGARQRTYHMTRLAR